MNVAAIKKNFSELGGEIKVFLLFVLCADKNGAVTLEKEKIVNRLGISRQTVGKYIKGFVTCGIMKYKYSGKAMFNPDFMYVGPEEERNKLKEKYQAFKSDV